MKHEAKNQTDEKRVPQQLVKPNLEEVKKIVAQYDAAGLYASEFL